VSEVLVGRLVDAHSNQACEEACDAFESELFGRVDRIMAGIGGFVANVAVGLPEVLDPAPARSMAAQASTAACPE
jgi:hypothetical protein